jgi:hypothetical protein
MKAAGVVLRPLATFAATGIARAHVKPEHLEQSFGWWGCTALKGLKHLTCLISIHSISPAFGRLAFDRHGGDLLLWLEQYYC